MTFLAPKLGPLLETALYVEDLSRAARFYEEVLGLAPFHCDERMVAIGCGPGSVLLLFLRGATREVVDTPGGLIPGHDGAGGSHFAFAIATEDLSAWERRFVERHVPIESRVVWPRGGTSLYFRDPDANLVELATPGLWPNY
ncbi:MAG TPA: VOC family protein [Methylocystis sp.]|nr:VOC family protein [Methylocystis sp.]